MFYFLYLCDVLLNGICSNISYNIFTDEYVFDRNMTEGKLKTQWNLIGSVYGATPQSLQFGKQGVADLVVFSICLLLMIVSNRLEKQEIEAIDIAQQTTQDYSIVVKNPPADIRSEKVPLLCCLLLHHCCYSLVIIVSLSYRILLSCPWLAAFRLSVI